LSALTQAQHTHLGDHATSDDTLLNQLTALPNVEFMDLGVDVILVPQDTWDVCHEDQLLCLKGGRNLQYAQGVKHRVACELALLAQPCA
jgi:hypothetical protein